MTEQGIPGLEMPNAVLNYMTRANVKKWPLPEAGTLLLTGQQQTLFVNRLDDGDKYTIMTGDGDSVSYENGEYTPSQQAFESVLLRLLNQGLAVERMYDSGVILS